MALLSLQDVSISFGGSPLLEKVNMQVEKGERVCLLGRNGEGKTTLLKLISGRMEPDSGVITLQKGTRVAGLSQELPIDLAGSVHEVVAGGLAGVGSLLEEYHQLTSRLAHGTDEFMLRRIGLLQERLEGSRGWQIRQQVDKVLTRLALEPDVRFETLSVGFRRRTLLARALVAEPDILLLDEPTNHLDITAIGWVEEFLQKYRGTLILVTHDRVFLQKLATRIIEIDRGRLVSWACGYGTFLERRQAALDVEEAQRKQFNRRLAKEEEWIRKGIKARRTRNEGRVRALMKMREAQQAQRRQTGGVRIQIQEAESTGKLVIEASKISHGYGGAVFIRDFSTKIIRGDRIGIIGPNGIGKSTLLRILIGEITSDSGRVRTGTKLEVVYFDQLREQLDEDMTVQESVADGKDTVQINGRQRHVIGYLKDFLFTPDRARSPVRILSGGERNRLLLARLFAQPSNVLVLDEPTNDLDMETLELLEERLLEYTGTILLMSHDRAFLDNVVTSTLVFEAGGVITEYAGGYDDWLRQRPRPADKIEPGKGRPSVKRREKKDPPRKLSFKEGKELEALPGRIEILEREQKGLYEQMATPEFYRSPGDRISRARARVEELAQELEGAYVRWEELESISEANS
ncbi:MAG TPA: ATP-binding cassette domain-containing protein [Deltaproteobacteria bacterium]|nr:ATP-binding cassette domain-containing protein [Deltaproteobacteria bacterium]